MLFVPAANAFHLRQFPALPVGTAGTFRSSGTSSTSAAIAILVDVEIKHDRVEEFLEAMKVDAEGSREEKGCMRFDVFRDKEKPNRFFFYEVYKDSDAVAAHKATNHFKVWSDFKVSGGVLSQTSTKADFPGDWGFK